MRSTLALALVCPLGCACVDIDDDAARFDAPISTAPAIAQAASPGAVVWQGTLHLDGGHFSPHAVEAAAGRVVVGGIQVVEGQQDVRVMARSAATGEVLWDHTLDRDGGYEFITDMVVTAKDVVIAGGAQKAPGGDVDALVARYDAATGALLWVSYYDRPTVQGEDDALGIELRGRNIVIAGQSQAETDFDVLIQGYDLGTGELLWTDTVDFAGKFDAATDVAIAGSRAVLSGYVTGVDNSYDVLAAAYDLHSGTPIWLSTFDNGGAGRGLAIAGSGTLAYLAGGVSSSLGSRSDMFVRALDTESGATVWASELDINGFADTAWDVVVQGDVVVAAGEGRPMLFSPDMLTRAFDAATGEVLWTDQYDVGVVDYARAVTISGGAAFVVGVVTDTDPDWMVRALDLADGGLLWQDRLDQSGGYDSADVVTSFGDRIYVAGDIQEAGTGATGSHADFAIRAYAR